MEESSDTILIAVISGSTDVGVIDDRRKKKPSDDCVPPFDPNKMLQNKNVQVENEEDNEGDNYLLGCADMAVFEPNLHSLFNASNKRTFKGKTLQNIQQSARNCINDLVTDETEVGEFEEDDLGNFSIDVLILAIQDTYGSYLLHYT
eukprot:1078890-Ditylum_brightwellii.AAC.1